jgi:DNA-binding NtrC family response regulator
LVVDDEPVSRRVAYRILSEEGFRVLEAGSRAETLDALRQAHGRVDLLMLDVVMPECDGVAIGRHVLEEWPGQRILYMSAHPAEVLARHGHTTLNVPFLAKPYTRDEVLAKVKEALEQPRRRKRILVVDDNASIRSSLGKMLATAGHEVLLAENGSEATRLWQEGGADLVIVDLFMPEKDGLETIIELRAHSPGISIIAMSGGGTRMRMDLLPEAKLLGATVTIDKPFTPADMMATVNSVLKDSASVSHHQAPPGASGPAPRA